MILNIILSVIAALVAWLNFEICRHCAKIVAFDFCGEHQPKEAT